MDDEVPGKVSEIIESGAYCACSTEVRWNVFGKLYCSRCLPVEHRAVFLPDARPEDLEEWGANDALHFRPE